MRDLARLAECEWEALSVHARQKRIIVDGQIVRLLELHPGFEEPAWCQRQHIGFVVSGAFQIAFSDRNEPFSTGDAFVLSGGSSGQHKAIVSECGVTLFLVEPV